MKILYHESTRPTALALAEALGAMATMDRMEFMATREGSTNREPMVNWGRRLPYRDNPVILNGNHQYTKMAALTRMSDEGVSVPPFLSGDLLIRKPRTRGGRGIRRHHGFVTAFIPKDFEFRVDVFMGRASRIHVKTGDPDRVSWNRDGSEWTTFGSRRMRSSLQERFGIPRETTDKVIEESKNAVRVLGLDFGAVDVIRSADTGRIFVLEVNTAPSLGEGGIRKYAKLITRWAEGLHDVG